MGQNTQKIQQHSLSFPLAASQQRCMNTAEVFHNYSAQFKSRFVSTMFLFLYVHFLWRSNDFFTCKFKGRILGACMPAFALEVGHVRVDRTLINRRLAPFPETSARHIAQTQRQLNKLNQNHANYTFYLPTTNFGELD